VFDWDTENVPTGTYSIKAVASTLPDEINTQDNEYIDGTVTIRPKVVLDSLRIISETIDLGKGDSWLLSGLKSIGGALIVKVEGLEPSFLGFFRNTYQIQIYRDGLLYKRSHTPELDLISGPGDPAKAEIVLPRSLSEYSIKVTNRNLGFSCGPKTRITVFLSLQTKNSAKNTYDSMYNNMARSWQFPATPFLGSLLKVAFGGAPTIKGLVKFYLPDEIKLPLVLIQILTESDQWYSQSRELGLLTGLWQGQIFPELREKSTFDPGFYSNAEELKQIYSDANYRGSSFYSKYWPIGILSPFGENFISTELGYMAYLNYRTYRALEADKYEEAKAFMVMQREFITHLAWLADKTLPTQHPYYGILQITKEYVNLDTMCIEGFFSD